MVIYSLFGSLAVKKESFIVVEADKVGYKVFVSPRTLEKLPPAGEEVKLFTHLHVREDAQELYGFLTEAELNFFEQLISISGIGPRTALGVMAIASVDQLMAAINEGKTDLLTRAAGIGKKTAERVILELKGKLAAIKSAETVRGMESDLELEEALVGLGYSRNQARKAIDKLDSNIVGIEERLKTVLKNIQK